MIIALTAILTLWIAAALVLAFAGSNRTTAAAVDAALASNETISLNKAAWDEFDTARAAWAKDDVAAA